MSGWTPDELRRIGSAEELRIDRAYHAKYDRYGPAIVGSVTGAHAHDLTIRLVPGDTVA